MLNKGAVVRCLFMLGCLGRTRNIDFWNGARGDNMGDCTRKESLLALYSNQKTLQLYKETMAKRKVKLTAPNASTSLKLRLRTSAGKLSK